MLSRHRCRPASTLRQTSHSLEVPHSRINSRLRHPSLASLLLEPLHRQTDALLVVRMLRIVSSLLLLREQSSALLVALRMSLVLLLYREAVCGLVDLAKIVAHRRRLVHAGVLEMHVLVRTQPGEVFLRAERTLGGVGAQEGNVDLLCQVDDRSGLIDVLGLHRFLVSVG
jgi:hypothetical protein